MFQSTVYFNRAVALFALFNMVLSCTNLEDDPAQTFGDPIEGVWLLGDDQPVLTIAPCGREEEDGFCGTLTKMPKDDEALISQSSPDWWWQDGPIQTVTQLRPTQVEGEYAGYIYDQDLDETLHLQLVQTNDKTIEAVVYFGANFDEAVDMAIGAAFSPVKVTDLAWLLVRAGVGKTWLSSNQTWHRSKTG